MTVDIVYNGKKYFLKLNYSGPNHFKFEVLEFSNLDQIKEFLRKTKDAVNKFEFSYDIPHDDDFIGYVEN